jgi:hypothetical protein
MKVYYQWLEFRVGNRAYGGGGWSRKAKSRPAPEIREGFAEAFRSGKSWMVDGQRKLKLNLWNSETGEELKRDYPKIKAPAWLQNPLVRQVKAVQGVPEPSIIGESVGE